MKRDYDCLVSRVAQETKRYYGKRLVSIAVFGSVGRATPNPESDIDILIVADRLPRGRMRRVREFDRIEERLNSDIDRLKATGIHTSISPVFKTREETLRGSLLFLDIIEDGVILYDRDRFLARYLGDFRKRLKKLGARRIVRGNAWYWELKPDYVAGEVFEI